MPAVPTTTPTTPAVPTRPAPVFTKPKPIGAVQRRLLEPFVESAQSYVLANAGPAQLWVQIKVDEAYAFFNARVDGVFLWAKTKVAEFEL